MKFFKQFCTKLSPVTRQLSISAFENIQPHIQRINNKEKTTHFGFKTVSESEKMEQGTLYSIFSPECR